MFENLGDMSKMFASLQENAKKLQEELETKRYSVSSGGGMVEVTLNAKGEVLDISIDDSLLEDKESLQILLIGALNDAYKMLEQDRQNIALRAFGNFSGFGEK